MGRKSSKAEHKTVPTQELVTVAFAEDVDLAREYKQLLEENEIPALIKKHKGMSESGFSDIAIMVPEEMLDEAYALISEKASYDDFFEGAFHNEPDYDEISDDISGGLYNDDDDD